MKEDPGLFDYWPYDNRPKIKWPNGARVAFWVAPNIEFYELDPAVNPHPKAWPQSDRGLVQRQHPGRVQAIRRGPSAL